MRYIDINYLKVKDKILLKAKKATEEIIEIEDIKSKKEHINDNSYIWKDFRAPLAELSYGKCWYCESQIDRQWGDIDHFRPKKGVMEDPEYEGYWWLAYDYTNFRYSCIICNRPNIGEQYSKHGKGNHFPLCPGSTRAKFREELKIEKPFILDPTNLNDPPLLYFDENGVAKPGVINKEDINYKRADYTIVLFHLNKKGLKRKRKTIIHQCKIYLQVVDKILRLALNKEENKELYDNLIAQGKNLIRDSALFSSSALIHLKTSKNKWVNENIISD